MLLLASLAAIHYELAARARKRAWALVAARARQRRLQLVRQRGVAHLHEEHALGCVRVGLLVDAPVAKRDLLYGRGPSAASRPAEVEEPRQPSQLRSPDEAPPRVDLRLDVGAP